MHVSSTESGITATTETGRSKWYWIAGGAIGVLTLATLASLAWLYMMRPPDVDVSRSVLTEAGIFQATIVPAIDPVPVNQLHTWILRVQSPDGRPVASASIEVDGDMPQHRHGMPTVPTVTQDLGNGEYLVEGMRFQMGGWWVIEFMITVDGQTDIARFNLVL